MAMSWEIVWDEGLGAVRVTIHGVFTSVEFALMSEAVLSQPYWYPGADVLFDYRDCVIEQGFSEIHSAAESTASAADRIGGGKLGGVN